MKRLVALASMLGAGIGWLAGLLVHHLLYDRVVPADTRMEAR